MANLHGSSTAGTVILLLGFGIFFYTGYQTMIYGENMRVSHHVEKNSGGELHAGGDGISSSSWIFSGSGAPSTGVLLVVATIITLVGGVVAQGPLKPIVIAKAPPVTGEYPEFRDFISFNNRGSIISAAADQS